MAPKMTGELDRFTVRATFPILIICGMLLFLWQAPPIMYLLLVPVVPIVVFMATLGEFREHGNEIRIKTLFQSLCIPRPEVRSIERSFLEGISTTRLNRFVPPWGRVFYVEAWSNRDPEEDVPSRWDPLISILLAISGFGTSWKVRLVHIQDFPIRIAALLVSAALFVSFALLRRRNRGLANCMLYIAGFVGALVWL